MLHGVRSEGQVQTVEPNVPSPLLQAAEDMLADYASVGMTLGKHPLAFIRKKLVAKRCKTSVELDEVPHSRREKRGQVQ